MQPPTKRLVLAKCVCSGLFPPTQQQHVRLTSLFWHRRQTRCLFYSFVRFWLLPGVTLLRLVCWCNSSPALSGSCGSFFFFKISICVFACWTEVRNARSATSHTPIAAFGTTSPVFTRAELPIRLFHVSSSLVCFV